MGSTIMFSSSSLAVYFFYVLLHIHVSRLTSIAVITVISALSYRRGERVNSGLYWPFRLVGMSLNKKLFDMQTPLQSLMSTFCETSSHKHGWNKYYSNIKQGFRSRKLKGYILLCYRRCLLLLVRTLSAHHARQGLSARWCWQWRNHLRYLWKQNFLTVTKSSLMNLFLNQEHQNGSTSPSFFFFFQVKN